MLAEYDSLSITHYSIIQNIQIFSLEFVNIGSRKSGVKWAAAAKNPDEIGELTSSCSGGVNKPIVNRTRIQVCRYVHRRYLLFSLLQTCLPLSTARMCDTIYTPHSYTVAPCHLPTSERERERKKCTFTITAPGHVSPYVFLQYNVYLVSERVHALVPKNVHAGHLHLHREDGSFYEQFNVSTRSFLLAARRYE